MPLIGVGNPANGAPFAQCEYQYRGATVTIPASGSLAQGQAVIRDVTQIPGEAGFVGTSATASLADMCVVPTASTGANAPVYGVYQGATITNASSTQALVVTVSVLYRGMGQVLATAKTAGTAITVGASLITESGTDGFTIAGSAALNKTVGVATATGANTTYGATLIAVPGSGSTSALVNAMVDIR